MTRLSPFRRLLLAAALIFLALFAAVVSAGAATPVRVGVHNFSPLVFIDREGRPKGLFVDILEHVAEQEGWQLRYVPGTWAETLERLEKGEVDLVACIGISEERARVFDFANEHLVIDWGSVYGRRGGKGLDTVIDLNGKRIAVLRSSIYTAGFRHLLKQFNIRAELVEKEEYRDVFRAVDAGEVDAGICTNFAGLSLEPEFAVERGHILFSPVRISFAVRKGRNGALVALLDHHITRLKLEEGSLYHRKFDEWVGGARPWRLPRGVIWGGAALAAGLVWVGVSALILRRRVDVKTRELVTANREIARSEADFRGIFEQAAVGAAQVRPDGHFLRMNGKLCEILGYAPEELYKLSFRDITHPDDLAADLDAVEKLLAGELSTYRREKRYIRRDGETIWCQLTSALVRDADGSPWHFVSIVEDVTTRRKAETERNHLREQLLRAQKMELIGQLAGGIAHDFNNILSGINGYVALARIKGEDSADACLASIEQLADKATRLTRNLLAFSRKQPSEKSAIDIGAVVAESVEVFCRIVGSGIRVETKLADVPLPVRGDPGQLEQVLLNLVTNACQAMPDGGLLTVECEEQRVEGEFVDWYPEARKGRFAVVRVADTGTGIPPEHLGRIFEPFYTTKEVGQGTGLGLAMVYGIVKEHAGFVQVESTPGRGSTFSVYVPILDGTAAAAHVGVPGRGGSETILVADAAPIARQLVRYTLEEFGYRIIEAVDGDEVLRVVAERPDGIDLVMIDPALLNGRVWAELVAQGEKGRIIFLGGQGAPVKAPACAAGARADWLVKPVRPSDVLTKVREVLDR